MDRSRLAGGTRRAWIGGGLGLAAGLRPGASRGAPAEPVGLPAPARGMQGSLQAALAHRRSVRAYTPEALDAAQLAALLWAAQGVSDARGRRTTPSAGALYPLETFAVARRVGGIAPGSYRYLPARHALEPWPAPADTSDLQQAALGQQAVGAAPLVIALAAVTTRTAAKYGSRAARYVAIEAGAAAQGIGLEAAALGLGAVVIGAFDDDAVARALRLPPGAEPLLLMPVGRPAP